jgi:hypothetical protein
MPDDLVQAIPPPPPQVPPTGWMQGMDDANRVVQEIIRANQRRFIAHIEPLSSSPLPLTATSPTALSGSGRKATSIFEQNLAERTEAIRDTARALAQVIEDQIGELNRSKPNDDDTGALTKHNAFVDFLKMVAGELLSWPMLSTKPSRPRLKARPSRIESYLEGQVKLPTI